MEMGETAGVDQAEREQQTLPQGTGAPGAGLGHFVS